MADSSTNLSMNKPLVNDPTDQDLWGGQLNTNVDIVDGEFATRTINQDYDDKILSKPILVDYAEENNAVSSSSNAITLDLTTGNHFSTTLSENITTVTISNPSPTGNKCAIVWEITQDSTARTITWPAAVKWPGGTAITLSTGSGEIDEVVLTTRDAGTTWLATTRGQAFA
jgi:hypothetical protein